MVTSAQCVMFCTVLLFSASDGDKGALRLEVCFYIRMYEILLLCICHVLLFRSVFVVCLDLSLSIELTSLVKTIGASEYYTIWFGLAFSEC